MKKLLQLTVTGLLLIGAGVGYAWEQDELLIWVNGDKGYRGLAELGKAFEAEMGIKVTVEAPEGLADKFQQAAKSGKGPDILLWAHDRLGEWADAGLVQPVSPSNKVKAENYELGWEAFTHKGKVWGYPVAFEAVSLIYNTDLISEPPSQIKDMAAVNDEVKKKNPEAMTILWDYNNTYFTWGILAANGGYVFKKTDGGYDTRDVGVATEGAVNALEEIVGLIEQGVMAKGATYSVMESKMNSGELAMMISGPWAWGNLQKSGIKFDLAPVPGSGGKPGQPFVGVLGALLNRSTPNEDLAVEFIENWLMQPKGLKMVDDDVPLGVPSNKAFYEQVAKGNPLIAKTKVNVDNGEPMPNVPEMGRFWSSMEAALENATNQQAKPKAVLENAKDTILNN
ncbi:maltose/maltodextrin ABC transporter substrate-binding protein MalE [Kiritimatiellaeota bacterium B1221]|nr:maltose/maltodextrin ABC transporter substrate-binding protein MalE [Kiritimatiellaeota bacterium B1221]